MVSHLSLELAKASEVLVRDMIKVKLDEEVLIYADMESDRLVVEETAKAVSNVGSKLAVLWYKTPSGVGEDADQYLPRSLAAAMANCDIMIEFSNKYLLYSTPWRKAMETHRVRYVCLSGMDTGMMVRCIGRVNMPVLVEFQDKLADLTMNAEHMHVVTPAGTDVTFRNDRDRPVFREGVVLDKPGEYMLIGQVDWAPIEDSLNGTIVFDGSVWPPEELGLIKTPIALEVEKGKVIGVKGGWQANVYEKWLRSFQDPAMLNLAHISYGCNPGAKLTGRMVEDERVWGCVQWGLGYQAESFRGKAGPAKSHTDGTCLNPSVWIDNVQIEREGSYIHADLAALARKLGRS
jgi:leucyl aminopeptidase (aminopeptidase T)